MKMIWSLATIALVLPFAGACSRTRPSIRTPCRRSGVSRRDRRQPWRRHATSRRSRKTCASSATPARAAEQLGYRFIARARLSNDAGYYKVAEQAAACLESIVPDEPAALLLRGHVLHQMHRFGEAEAIARRLVTLREFVLDFGLLGDALMEQGRWRRRRGPIRR